MSETTTATGVEAGVSLALQREKLIVWGAQAAGLFVSAASRNGSNFSL